MSVRVCSYCIGRRTWWPRPASRRSPPGGTSPRARPASAWSGSVNIFRAVLADGSRVKGMVFPGELIWDDDPPPRASAGLVGKGR